MKFSGGEKLFCHDNITTLWYSVLVWLSPLPVETYSFHIGGRSLHFLSPASSILQTIFTKLHYTEPDLKLLKLSLSPLSFPALSGNIPLPLFIDIIDISPITYGRAKGRY